MGKKEKQNAIECFIVKTGVGFITLFMLSVAFLVGYTVIDYAIRNPFLAEIVLAVLIASYVIGGVVADC